MCVNDRNSVLLDKNSTEFFHINDLVFTQKNYIVGKVVIWPTEKDLAIFVSIWKSLRKLRKTLPSSCFPFN